MRFDVNFFSVTMILEYGSFKIMARAVLLSEVNHLINWHSALDAADDDIVGVLAEPLECELLEWWQ